MKTKQAEAVCDRCCRVFAGDCLPEIDVFDGDTRVYDVCPDCKEEILNFIETKPKYTEVVNGVMRNVYPDGHVEEIGAAYTESITKEEPDATASGTDDIELTDEVKEAMRPIVKNILLTYVDVLRKAANAIDSACDVIENSLTESDEESEEDDK